MNETVPEQPITRPAECCTIECPMQASALWLGESHKFDIVLSMGCAVMSRTAQGQERAGRCFTRWATGESFNKYYND